MTKRKITSPVRALGLCSGGLDSMLSGLILKKQGINVTWISFETPFFTSEKAQKASTLCDIPLITQDITVPYLEMMKAPKAGFGKNMNPCMDCHALMFETAGRLMQEMGFDFLFSGEVIGQRPKSQTRNALHYVEKNSRFKGFILRPLSALCLPETPMEAQGLVDRTRLLGINGRSRKQQIALARELGITEYPAPAGGCLLTNPQFSNRLRDLFYVQKTQDIRHIHLLRYGRHFRLTDTCKLVIGRTKTDNEKIMAWYDPIHDVRFNHAWLPGPTALLTGRFETSEIKKAAAMTAAYTKAPDNEPTEIQVSVNEVHTRVSVIPLKASELAAKMI
ncbi:MAG: tRNA 4-thiouridine(8) synthase ThiI [Desulfotignum sp.]|nr:tRNA 4-thiouridine(8) synthase ThiI [Desulfotignum sp.]